LPATTQSCGFTKKPPQLNEMAFKNAMKKIVEKNLLNISI